jgi:ATP-dependent DNA helicase RecQ
MSTARDPVIGGPELEAGLRKLGYAEFRPGQREAIEALLETGRLLLVAPTGGGKSLVYQLPASLLGGTSLVVSPLISLMQDQVLALEERGVPATFLASTLDAGEMQRRMARMARGAYKLVYVAPERIVFPGFRGLVRELGAALIAIDEAHCISEWGHDFRPEYLQLGELLADFPRARVLACTATATPVVRDEILAKLGLDAATPQMVHGFARPNLILRAREASGRRERETAADALLAEALGSPGAGRGTAIVYAPTRRLADEEGQRLARVGWLASTYHAGLAADERDRVQRAFAAGELEIVVATNAFGMGIDRADVRAVIHLGPPGSIEAYYQEVGRAGRDGADALGLLLTGPGDLALRRRLLELDVDGRAPDPAVVEHKWSLFLELMRWAEGGSCRHDAILRYFGDEAETLDGCGRCDACRELAVESGSADAEHVSLVVRKALSAVARVNGRFGLQVAAKLLRGAEDERLRWSGLDGTPTFGCLREYSDDWLLRLLRRCVAAGWVDFHGGLRPVAILTEDGRAVMRAEKPARLVLPPRQRPATAVSPAGDRARPRKPAAAPARDELDAQGLAIFEALRSHRLALARRQGVPPYVIASDRSLREIAQLRPRTLAELQLAHGIGPAKAQRYGAGLLEVVARGSGEAARSEGGSGS